MEDDRVRGRSGAWMAVATLAVYWGLAGAGFLLRAVNDPTMDEEVNLEALSAELLAVVDQTMQPTRASLWLRPPAPDSRHRVP
jgi:hypothetical protein